MELWKLDNLLEEIQPLNINILKSDGKMRILEAHMNIN